MKVYAFHKNTFLNAAVFIGYSAAFLLSGSQGWLIQGMVAGIATLILTFVCRKYLAYSYLRVYFFILPSVLLYGTTTLINQNLYTIPIPIIPIVTPLVYFCIEKLDSSYSAKFYFLLGIAVLICSYPLYKGMEIWFNNIHYQETSLWNKNNLDFSSIHYTSETGEQIQVMNESDTIYVLDFWNSTCGVCFKELPNFKIISEAYAHEKYVKFYSANIQLKKDDEAKVRQKIKRYFNQNLFIKDSTSLNVFVNQSVPFYMIVYKGEVKFAGGISLTKTAFAPDLYDEIDKVLDKTKKNL